jgi:phosphatidylserine/phosphatidylglycerophosphate/cardiolipin synthase-like enzyme
VRLRAAKWVAVTVVAAFLAGGIAAGKEAAKSVRKTKLPGPAATETVSVEVYFAPSYDCTAAIVKALHGARKTIQAQAFRMTSVPIAEEIVARNKAGVAELILLDDPGKTANYSDATFYHNMGVEVLMDNKHPIAHNKIIIIDEGTADEVVITGSFNFSKQAESNGENLLIIRRADRKKKSALIAAYVANFNEHKMHCVPYAPK